MQRVVWRPVQDLLCTTIWNSLIMEFDDLFDAVELNIFSIAKLSCLLNNRFVMERMYVQYPSEKWEHSKQERYPLQHEFLNKFMVEECSFPPRRPPFSFCFDRTTTPPRLTQTTNATKNKSNHEVSLIVCIVVTISCRNTAELFTLYWRFLNSVECIQRCITPYFRFFCGHHIHHTSIKPDWWCL